MLGPNKFQSSHSIKSSEILLKNTKIQDSLRPIIGIQLMSNFMSDIIKEQAVIDFKVFLKYLVA